MIFSIRHRARLHVLLTICILLLWTHTAGASGVISITPESADPGDQVNATIILDANASPPLPPSDVLPTAVKIGTIEGSSINRSNETTVTATFDIPVDQADGNYDVTVEFTTPENNIISYTLNNGFQIGEGSAGVMIYVDQSNTSGTYDGASWATAYQNVPDAIADASGGGGEIWVAAGTYYPTTTSDRSVSIELDGNIRIYGGFEGDESLLSQRDYVTNVTILSGDIGTPGDSTDNSYHVLIGADNATLDGFTITGGYADGIRSLRLGGAMYNAGCSPTISNCTFSDNYAEGGGAVYNIGSDIGTYYTPTFTNCTFTNNTANNGGAILSRVGASAELYNCAFSGNTANWRGGAIFINYAANMLIDNCTFSNNTTDGNGGAVYIDDQASQFGGTTPVIQNSTFSGNSALYRGGAIGAYNSSCYPTVNASSFTSNTAGAGGGAIAIESGVELSYCNLTYSGNSGGSGDANIDINGTGTATEECR